MSAGVGVLGADGSLVVAGLEQQSAESWTVAVVAAPDPDDGLRDDLTPQDVSPGLLGFVVIFAAAVACIPLFLSMTRKLRKVDPRREKGAADGSGSDADPPEPDGSPDQGPAPDRGDSPDEGDPRP